MDSLRPRLPWEVIERAIDHSRGRSETLRSLALTCHQLLPRARLLMFAHVRFKSRDHVFAFVDFLEGTSYLKPIIRSITVWPSDLAPFPLLHILPNLREIKFFHHSNYFQKEPRECDWPRLHQSSLAGFRVQRFRTNIRTLHLSCLCFQTILPFAEILQTFRYVTHLICNDITINKLHGKRVIEPPRLSETVRRRLSERMTRTLKELTVDYGFLITYRGNATSMGQLLLGCTNSAPLAIENLAITYGRSYGDHVKPLTDILVKYQGNWSSLRSLTLRLPAYRDSLRDAKVVNFLEDLLECPPLKDITLEWQLQTRTRLNLVIFNLFSSIGTFKELGHTMLRFPKPKLSLVLTLKFPFPSNSTIFWLDELKKRMPMLSQYDVVIRHSHFEEVLPPGHEDLVLALVTSPDGKWIATGSEDSAIILWNTNKGTIAQQWVAHGYEAVKTLAFSSDSQYLVSSGEDHKAVVWNLSGAPIKIATLATDCEHLCACAWSNDDNTIAAGFKFGIIRLWDAHSFQRRAVHRVDGMLIHLTFSPDGSWLVCMTNSDKYSIFDVASGTLHMSLQSSNSPNNNRVTRNSKARLFTRSTAAFNPGSTHLAIASPTRSSTINIIDVANTRTTLLALTGTGKERVRDISFSPDGRLVLAVVTNTCYIWDATTGTNLFQLNGEDNTLASFSPCGKYIASASRSTLRLWSTSGGSRLGTLCADCKYMAFSPDGKTLSTVGDDNRVTVRRIRDIVPNIETLDDDPLIPPSPPSTVVDPNSRPSPLSKDPMAPYPNGATHADCRLRQSSGRSGAARRPIAGRQDAQADLEERSTEGDAGPSELGPWNWLLEDAFYPRDTEEGESAGAGSPAAGHERLESHSESVAQSSSGDFDSTGPTVRPTMVDDVPTSSARLSDLSLTTVERGARALMNEGWPPTRSMQEQQTESVWTKIPRAITTSSRRVANGVRKYGERLKKLGASVSMS